MKFQALLSVLALAILCVVPQSTGQFTSTSYVESTTIKSSNSTRTTFDTATEEPQNHDKDAEPAYYSQTHNSREGRTYDDGSLSMTKPPIDPTSTYPPDQSFSENPTPTVDCPGPQDSTTGEAVLDSDLNCGIVCYNNLILNDAGNACICPPTFQFDPVEVKCVCRSPFVQRGSKCVLLPSQAAGARHGSHKKRSLNQQLPLNFDMLHGKYLRSEVDRKHCPHNEIACPMKSGGFECLDPEVTLDSCGGCASLGTGLDCRNITGTEEVGCNAGICVVLTCQKGFKLLDGSCVPKHHRRL